VKVIESMKSVWRVRKVKLSILLFTFIVLLDMLLLFYCYIYFILLSYSVQTEAIQL